ncbi:MAG: VIT and VWA domain-containing protein [Phycisphaerae bacterium]|nr:VIT and VWA domain-containing protein [Phycisphaerae bacterium]
MNSRHFIHAAALWAILCMLCTACFGAGLLKPAGGSQDAVYMKSHHVQVTLNNGFARTEVDQVFGNASDQDLEATYSFPLPKQASLSELSLWINGQEVLGEVLEKQQARQVYEQQKRQGRDTALAEKDDYKTFDVKVSPVRAGADTRVRLVYYQPLDIDANVGRYLYPMAEGGVDEERIAFWSVDDKVHESFRFDLTLKSAFPVKEVRVPEYDAKAVINHRSPADANDAAQGRSTIHTVSIASPEGDALTRDIVVYYRLADDVPARLELVPYNNGQNPGTFMVVVTPAADLQPLSQGTDWTFVLDISGSMSGGKMATLCRGVSRVIGQMNDQDRFRIITFNQTAQDVTNGYIQATPANVQSTLEQVKRIRANGSTNLFAGLEMAYHGLDADRSSGVIVVTDGVANVGNTQHAQFLALLKTCDIRLFTFVIGNSANQPLMDRLARDSGGFAMNLSDSDDIIGRILQAKAKILYENMRDVTLTFSGDKVSDVTPAIMPNLYQGQQLVLFGHYTQPGQVKITMKATITGEHKTWHCVADLPKLDTDNPEIERLWALSRIDGVMEQIREQGETETLKQQVMDLGTAYSLVTDYTSMVVLNDADKENAGIQTRNASRVQRERQAQAARQRQPVKHYRADNTPQNQTQQTTVTTSQEPSTSQSQPRQQPSSNSSNQGMFKGRRSPGFGGGTGPVGPLFMTLLFWARRKTRKKV